MIRVVNDGVPVYYWDSPAELAEAAASAKPRRASWCDHDGINAMAWTGETFDSAVENARRGRTDLVPEAEKILEDVMAHIDAPKSTWVASRVGAYACVPDALIGHPDAMRRRVTMSDDHAPVRIFIDLVSSGAIGVRDLRRRGVACLALAMALAAERPVEVFGVIPMGVPPTREDRARGKHEYGATINVVRIGSAPLDLAVACNGLTSAGFIRNIGYGWLARDGADGRWAWECAPSADAKRGEYLKRLRAALGATDDDVIVAPPHINDPSFRDPVAFVQRSIAEHAKSEE